LSDKFKEIVNCIDPNYSSFQNQKKILWSYSFLYLILIFLFFSCNQWSPANEEVVARVGNVYLYRKDLNQKFTFSSTSDSILKARNFIDTWARNQLMVRQAEVNLTQRELDTLEQLVQDYKNELYINSYKTKIISKGLDTLVDRTEIIEFASKNEEVFKLKAPLYRVRYIHLPPDNVDQTEIQKSFQRFNATDRNFLDSLSFQYYSYILSDSLWINKNSLTSRVRFLNQENFNKYIKKSQFFKIEDSLGVYLFFLKEFLEIGDLAPEEVFSPTIRNIILNQRKLEFGKLFQKDILQDALRSKTYEIY